MHHRDWSDAASHAMYTPVPVLNSVHHMAEMSLRPPLSNRCMPPAAKHNEPRTARDGLRDSAELRHLEAHGSPPDMKPSSPDQAERCFKDGAPASVQLQAVFDADEREGRPPADSALTADCRRQPRQETKPLKQRYNAALQCHTNSDSSDVVQRAQQASQVRRHICCKCISSLRTGLSWCRVH